MKQSKAEQRSRAITPSKASRQSKQSTQSTQSNQSKNGESRKASNACTVSNASINEKQFDDAFFVASVSCNFRSTVLFVF